MLTTDGLMEKVPPGCSAKHVDGMLEVTANDVISCCVTIEWWANVVGLGSYVRGAGIQTETYVKENIAELRSKARAFFAGLEAMQEQADKGTLFIDILDLMSKPRIAPDSIKETRKVLTIRKPLTFNPVAPNIDPDDEIDRIAKITRSVSKKSEGWP